MTTGYHDQILDRREIDAALLRALELRHEVLDAIVASADRSAALRKVSELLDTTEFCADAVLNLQFYRLSKVERMRIRDELADLDATLKWLPSDRPFSTGANVRLRPFTDSESDAELFRLRSVERLEADGTPWSPKRVQEELRAGLRRIADETAAWFVAENTADAEPRGVGLVFGELTGRETDVAIWIAPKARKQGFGTAALKQARSELAAYLPGCTLVVRSPTG